MTCTRVAVPTPPVVKENVFWPTPLLTVLPFTCQVIVEFPMNEPMPAASIYTVSFGPGLSGEMVYSIGSGGGVNCGAVIVVACTKGAKVRKRNKLKNLNQMCGSASCAAVTSPFTGRVG